jgi:hypothetical protein
MTQMMMTTPTTMMTAKIARKMSILLFDEPFEPPSSEEIVIEPVSLTVSPA